MTRSPLTAVALMALLATGACGRGGPAATEVTPVETTLGVEGRASATPALAALGTVVVAAWSTPATAGGADIYTAVSADGGATFAPPTRVNRDEAAVGGEQGPRLALAKRDGMPEITVLWGDRTDGGRRLLTSRSTDGGRTFGEPSVVPGSDAPGTRGWQTLGWDGAGAVSVVWLDHRRHAGAARAPAGSHEHRHAAAAADTNTAIAADAVAFAQLSDLYVAPLDGSRAAMPVTAGVCYCCKTAAAYGPGGALYLAWRHVYDGSVRDIAFTGSRDGGRTFADPVRVSEDQWSIAGCPEDGPAIVVGHDGHVHVVWPTVTTAADGTMAKAIFYAMSADGRAFTPRVRLPTQGSANHPQVTLAPDGRIAVAWDEAGGGVRTLAAALGTTRPDGGVAFTRQRALDAAAGVYPVLASTVDRLLLAWTAGASDASTIHVRSLD